MYLFWCYVPKTHLEAVKNALFAAGAGRIGHYEHCAWQTEGKGQFRPLAGSQPYLGQIEEMTEVLEYKVEMVCAKEHAANIVQALKTAHPYEEPAYGLVKIAEF